jgi:hypothetical protein
MNIMERKHVILSPLFEPQPSPLLQWDEYDIKPYEQPQSLTESFCGWKENLYLKMIKWIFCIPSHEIEE